MKIDVGDVRKGVGSKLMTAAAIAAVPFTGGASLAALPARAAVAEVAGGIAAKTAGKTLAGAGGEALAGAGGEGIASKIGAGLAKPKSKAEILSDTLGQQSAQSQQNKQNQIQGAMDASRKHAEISTDAGTSMKGPMIQAWGLLKNEMRLAPNPDKNPHRENLLTDLKNFGGGNRILSNEDDSLSLENIHDDDMDIIERLAAKHGHEIQDEDESNPYKTGHQTTDTGGTNYGSVDFSRM